MKKKRNFSGLKAFMCSAVAMALSATIGSSVQAATFADTSGHWAETAIERWASYDVIAGYNGYFRPDDPITRGDMAVIINRIMDYQIESTRYYSDLDENYYTSPIRKLNSAGFMEGFDSTIRPKDFITREEAAVVIANAMHLDVRPTTDGTYETTFTDNYQIAYWAKNSIYMLNNLGALNGRSTNYFEPQVNITRAEVAYALDKLIEEFIYEKEGYSINSVNGTVVINEAGVSLENMTISGNLILAEGIADGDIYLDNIVVKGNIIIKGGSTNTIYVDDVTCNGRMEVSRVDAATLVKMRGSSSIPVIDIYNDCTVDGSRLDYGNSLGDVTIYPDAENVTILGDVDSVTNESPGCDITLGGNFGSVDMNQQGTVNDTSYSAGSKVEVGNIPATTADLAPGIYINPVFPNSYASAFISVSDPTIDVKTGDVELFIYVSSVANCDLMSVAKNAITITDGQDLDITVVEYDGGDETFGTTVYQVNFTVARNVETVELDVNFALISNAPDITIDKNFDEVDSTKDPSASVKITEIEEAEDGLITMTLIVSHMEDCRLPLDPAKAVTINPASGKDEDDYPEIVVVEGYGSTTTLTAYQISFYPDKNQDTLPLQVNFLDSDSESDFSDIKVTVNMNLPSYDKDEDEEPTASYEIKSLIDDIDAGVTSFRLQITDMEHCELPDDDTLAITCEDEDDLSVVTMINTGTRRYFYISVPYDEDRTKIEINVNFIDDTPAWDGDYLITSEGSNYDYLIKIDDSGAFQMHDGVKLDGGEVVTIYPSTGETIYDVQILADSITKVKDLTLNSDGSWTFTMPSSDITLFVSNTNVTSTMSVNKGANSANFDVYVVNNNETVDVGVGKSFPAMQYVYITPEVGYKFDGTPTTVDSFGNSVTMTQVDDYFYAIAPMTGNVTVTISVTEDVSDTYRVTADTSDGDYSVTLVLQGTTITAINRYVNAGSVLYITPNFSNGDIAAVYATVRGVQSYLGTLTDSGTTSTSGSMLTYSANSNVEFYVKYYNSSELDTTATYSAYLQGVDGGNTARVTVTDNTTTESSMTKDVVVDLTSASGWSADLKPESEIVAIVYDPSKAVGFTLLNGGSATFNATEGTATFSIRGALSEDAHVTFVLNYGDDLGQNDDLTEGTLSLNDRANVYGLASADEEEATVVVDEDAKTFTVDVSGMTEFDSDVDIFDKCEVTFSPTATGVTYTSKYDEATKKLVVTLTGTPSVDTEATLNLYFKQEADDGDGDDEEVEENVIHYMTSDGSVNSTLTMTNITTGDTISQGSTLVKAGEYFSVNVECMTHNTEVVVSTGNYDPDGGTKLVPIDGGNVYKMPEVAAYVYVYYTDIPEGEYAVNFGVYPPDLQVDYTATIGATNSTKPTSTTAEEGDEIQVFVTPIEGYTLSFNVLPATVNVTETMADGKQVFSFTMPKEAVSATMFFTEDEVEDPETPDVTHTIKFPDSMTVTDSKDKEIASGEDVNNGETLTLEVAPVDGKTPVVTVGNLTVNANTDGSYTYGPVTGTVEFEVEYVDVDDETPQKTLYYVNGVVVNNGKYTGNISAPTVVLDGESVVYNVTPITKDSEIIVTPTVVADFTATVTALGGTVTNEGNVFTVTPEEDSHVTIVVSYDDVVVPDGNVHVSVTVLVDNVNDTTGLVKVKDTEGDEVSYAEPGAALTIEVGDKAGYRATLVVNSVARDIDENGNFKYTVADTDNSVAITVGYYKLYSITTDLTVDKTEAIAGETVTVSGIGSDVTHIVVKDTATGAETTYPVTSATLTFDMPATNVEITAKTEVIEEYTISKDTSSTIDFTVANGGSFDMENDKAESGTTYTVTPTTSIGTDQKYVVTMSSTLGNVPYEEKDGAYTFVMPKADVTIKITSAAAEEGENDRTLTIINDTTAVVGTINPILAITSGGTTLENDATVQLNQVLTITEPVVDGYTVTMQVVGATDTGDETYTVTGNVTVVVTYTKVGESPVYTLKVTNDVPSDAVLTTDLEIKLNNETLSSYEDVVVTAGNGFEITNPVSSNYNVSVIVDGVTSGDVDQNSNVVVVVTYTSKDGTAQEYDITVTTDPTTGGTATASTTKAIAGTSITIDATPESGYSVSDMYYTMDDGTERKIAYSGATGSFNMPAGAVEVTVEFAQEGSITTKTTGITTNVDNVPVYKTDMSAATTATVNETLLIIPTIYDGFTISSVTVTVNGSENVLSGSGMYNYTMPDSAITITVNYVEESNLRTVNNSGDEEFQITATGIATTVIGSGNGTNVAETTEITVGIPSTITAKGGEIDSVTINGITQESPYTYEVGATNNIAVVYKYPVTTTISDLSFEVNGDAVSSGNLVTSGTTVTLVSDKEIKSFDVTKDDGTTETIIVSGTPNFTMPKNTAVVSNVVYANSITVISNMDSVLTTAWVSTQTREDTNNNFDDLTGATESITTGHQVRVEVKDGNALTEKASDYKVFADTLTEGVFEELAQISANSKTYYGNFNMPDHQVTVKVVYMQALEISITPADIASASCQVQVESSAAVYTGLTMSSLVESIVDGYNIPMGVKVTLTPTPADQIGNGTTYETFSITATEGTTIRDNSYFNMPDYAEVINIHYNTPLADVDFELSELILVLDDDGKEETKDITSSTPSNSGTLFAFDDTDNNKVTINLSGEEFDANYEYAFTVVVTAGGTPLTALNQHYATSTNLLTFNLGGELTDTDDDQLEIEITFSRVLVNTATGYLLSGDYGKYNGAPYHQLTVTDVEYKGDNVYEVTASFNHYVTSGSYVLANDNTIVTNAFGTVDTTDTNYSSGYYDYDTTSGSADTITFQYEVDPEENVIDFIVNYGHELNTEEDNTNQGNIAYHVDVNTSPSTQYGDSNYTNSTATADASGEFITADQQVTIYVEVEDGYLPVVTQGTNTLTRPIVSNGSYNYGTITDFTDHVDLVFNVEEDVIDMLVEHNSTFTATITPTVEDSETGNQEPIAGKTVAVESVEFNRATGDVTVYFYPAVDGYDFKETGGVYTATVTGATATTPTISPTSDANGLYYVSWVDADFEGATSLVIELEYESTVTHTVYLNNGHDGGISFILTDSKGNVTTFEGASSNTDTVSEGALIVKVVKGSMLQDDFEGYTFKDVLVHTGISITALTSSLTWENNESSGASYFEFTLDVNATTTIILLSPGTGS